MLTPYQIHDRLTVLVRNERKITAEILEHLKLISLNKGFAKLGYGSLFDYCVKGLGYSESQAFRRASALKLFIQVPEVKSKIQDGSLNLTTLTQAQSFIRQEEKFQLESQAQGKAGVKKIDVAQKLEILKKIENKTQKNVEKELVSMSSQPKLLLQQKEAIKPITPEYSELKVTLDQKTIDQLQEVKDLYSNHLKEGSISELITFLCQMAKDKKMGELNKAKKQIEKLEIVKSKNIQTHVINKSQLGNNIYKGPDVKVNAEVKNLKIEDVSSMPDASDNTKLTTNNKSAIPSISKNNTNLCSVSSLRRLDGTKAISLRIRNYIYLRDNGQCTYQDPITKTKCTSKFKLHIDHIKPRCHNGTNHPSNLRLLCAQHNSQQAIEKIGVFKF